MGKGSKMNDEKDGDRERGRNRKYCDVGVKWKIGRCDRRTVN
jgi:hypothetical protein